MKPHEIDATGSIGKLIATAFGFGVFHVLSGPDHLSALATLSAGSSWRSFALGVRWGCGHSIGLILMAVIFILLDDSLNLDKLDIVTEVIVGIFMIALGLYGIHTAIKKYKDPESRTQTIDSVKKNQTYKEVPHDERTRISSTASEESFSPELQHPTRDPSPELSPSNSSPHRNTLVSIDIKKEEEDDNLEELDLESIADTLESHLQDVEDQVHTYSRWNWIKERSRQCKPKVDMENPTTQKATALCVGIIHGVAGPGGILGVMPAVRYHNWIRSMIYLGTFCVTSIVIMGLFAALYGELTSRLGQRSALIAFRINVISASLSVAVGILWITLVALGKMKAVFG